MFWKGLAELRRSNMKDGVRSFFLRYFLGSNLEGMYCFSAILEFMKLNYQNQ
ncbi:hypothetical protein IGK47_003840 [Enterococcus sp. AZ007]